MNLLTKYPIPVKNISGTYNSYFCSIEVFCLCKNKEETKNKRVMIASSAKQEGTYS